MDISKIEKWSPSSLNVYDDLRAVDLLSGPKVPIRSISTISYGTHREIDNPQAKQSTRSLVLPISIASNEQTTALETILSIDDTKRSSSSSVELIEQKHKGAAINRDYKVVYEENVPSGICWPVRLMIQLICILLLACFIGTFIFTLTFNAFDNYSFWWYNNNDTNFTEFDYDPIIQTIDYEDEY